MRRILCFIIVYCMYLQAYALTTEQYQFATSLQQQRFETLSQELRCLVCQNESLADSNALLAQDLRLQVANLIKQGNSDQQIIQYFVARYGNFVLFEPPLQTTTWLLWFAPGIFVFICAVILMRVTRYAKKSLDDEYSGDMS